MRPRMSTSGGARVGPAPCMEDDTGVSAAPKGPGRLASGPEGLAQRSRGADAQYGRHARMPQFPNFGLRETAGAREPHEATPAPGQRLDRSLPITSLPRQADARIPAWIASMPVGVEARAEPPARAGAGTGMPAAATLRAGEPPMPQPEPMGSLPRFPSSGPTPLHALLQHRDSSSSDISADSFSSLDVSSDSDPGELAAALPDPDRHSARRRTPLLLQGEAVALRLPPRAEQPSRLDAMQSATTRFLHALHLPQAGSALANASITSELGAKGRRLLRPLQLAMDAGATLLQASSGWLRRPRMSSEALQQVLLGEGVDLSRPEFQNLAHEHAVDYGRHAATMLDTALPTVHAILKLGGAGTAMTFGLGRNAGLAAGDALGRAQSNLDQARGFVNGPELAARTLPSDTAFKMMGTGVQQWLLGSITGAFGNLAGQYLASPLVNLVPRQFRPIDLRAVLPDETVALMNQLEPGAGDRLRSQVQDAQHEVDALNSNSNVRLGQIAFDSITAASFTIRGGLPLGVAGQVSAGLAVSASAGMVIGAVMAARRSVASHEVPDLQALREAAETHAAHPGSDGSAALAKVRTNAVPLFFPCQTARADGPEAPRDIETGHGAEVANANPAERSRLAGMRDAARRAVQQVASPLVAVGQAWSQSLSSSPLIEPAPRDAAGTLTAGRVLATASNVAASVANRAGEMAKATLTTSTMATGSAMLASSIHGPAREFVLAIGNAVGIHAAIKPWFNAVTTAIPQGDARIRALRDAVVNG